MNPTPERQLEIAKECGARREHHPDLTELFVLNFWPEELNAYTSRVIAEATAAQQAKIDRLMLEYYPDEMTEEQLRVWGESQATVRKEG